MPIPASGCFTVAASRAGGLPSVPRETPRRTPQMAAQNGKTKAQPRQQQARRPGLESEMRPRPRVEDPKHKGTGKLRDKVALITGGDSGIGRAVALLFAKEGANISIVYLNEHSDAEETK